MKGTGTVQFDQTDSYQSMSSGVPQGAGALIRFSGCGQWLKPVSVKLAMAASLKRSSMQIIFPFKLAAWTSFPRMVFSSRE
jgi:hypothetical protein